MPVKNTNYTVFFGTRTATLYWGAPGMYDQLDQNQPKTCIAVNKHTLPLK